MLFEFNVTRLPPSPTRIKKIDTLKISTDPSIFGPPILKLCSDKSESGESANEKPGFISPHSDLSKHSFGISGLNEARIN